MMVVFGFTVQSDEDVAAPPVNDHHRCMSV